MVYHCIIDGTYVVIKIDRAQNVTNIFFTLVKKAGYSVTCQVVSVTDCSVNDLGSLPTRDTDCKVFSAMQGN